LILKIWGDISGYFSLPKASDFWEGNACLYLPKSFIKILKNKIKLISKIIIILSQTKLASLLPVQHLHNAAHCNARIIY